MAAGIRLPAGTVNRINSISCELFREHSFAVPDTLYVYLGRRLRSVSFSSLARPSGSVLDNAKQVVRTCRNGDIRRDRRRIYANFARYLVD